MWKNREYSMLWAVICSVRSRLFEDRLMPVPGDVESAPGKLPELSELYVRQTGICRSIRCLQKRDKDRHEVNLDQRWADGAEKQSR
jgi:hypothetical protein